MLSLGYTADVINQLWATGLKYTLFHVYDCKPNNNNKVVNFGGGVQLVKIEKKSLSSIRLEGKGVKEEAQHIFFFV